MKKNVIVAGAGGRDFSNYLVYFKDNPYFDVVCFTAAQIPGIEKRKFSTRLCGPVCRRDIPIYPESKLKELIKKYKANYVFLSYSDLSHQEVMEKASFVLSCGANFGLLGTKDTWVESKKPVISVTAVRTGSGKSQTSRVIGKILRNYGKKVVAVRHAMPYGNDLTKQTCQRFANVSDFKKYSTTIEEEEEYQPWIDNGFVVYSGFDYKEIVKKAEEEAEVIIFDGGNNDLPFIKPDLMVVVADPHRAGHELTYYPGFVNFLMANVIIINKIDSAPKSGIVIVEKNIKKYNPKAIVIKAKSEIFVDKPDLIKGKRVLLVEDGPTITHGGMKFGAATVAAKKFKARFIVDARKYAKGSIKEAYLRYKHLGKELPAMGYSQKQIKELEETINKAKCDIVINGSPSNLKKILKVNKPIVNVTYELDNKAVKELHKILKKKGFI